MLAVTVYTGNSGQLAKSGNSSMVQQKSGRFSGKAFFWGRGESGICLPIISGKVSFSDW